MITSTQNLSHEEIATPLSRGDAKQPLRVDAVRKRSVMCCLKSRKGREDGFIAYAYRPFDTTMALLGGKRETSSSSKPRLQDLMCSMGITGLFFRTKHAS